MKNELYEGRLGDALVVAVIVRKLLKPITSTEAYKLGLIDSKGKRIRKPENSKEKESYTILDKFIFKLKSILGHRVSILSTFLLLLSDIDYDKCENEYNFLIEEFENDKRTRRD